MGRNVLCPYLRSPQGLDARARGAKEPNTESLHCQARNENTEMVYELSRTFKEARIEVIRLALIALDFLFR